jgi:hypothetical protein
LPVGRNCYVERTDEVVSAEYRGIAIDGPLLITGASSQIGRCALQRLEGTGVLVYALGRQRLGFFKEQSCQFFRSDLTIARPDFPDEATSLIHIASIWLLPPHLKTLRNNGLRRLVCFSSTAIYNKTESVNTGEREVARRMIQAEEEIARQCESLGIAWTVLRPTLVYGLGLDRNVSRAARFVRRFKFYPLATGAVGLRQPVHADDLATAALAALNVEKASGKSYEVGGGERLPYREMISRIFDALELPRRSVPLPGLEYAVAAAGAISRKPEVTGDVVRRMRLYLICDNSAAEADIGYRPRAFLSGGISDLPG